LSNDLSIYLHVPFCLAKCPYCDFYSAAVVGALGVEPPEYFDLVEREFELLCRENRELRSRSLVTLYVGGGTPSLVEPALYWRFLNRLGDVFRIPPSLEWTVEVNPGTVGVPRLGELLVLGVSRLSIGVQSFSDATLERLGRVHRSAETRLLLDELRGYAAAPGFVWGIDLMFGAPGQTLEQWQADLDATVVYRPHHVSIYGMTVHEGTPFADLQRAGQLCLPDEESQREMFLLARRRLTQAGYEHYEVSNYALPGFRSRHNERYWTGGDYLGLGAAAHSFVGGMRWANPPDMAHYREQLLAGCLPRRLEPSPRGRALLGEQVMLGLRRLEGIDPAAFRSRFGADLPDVYGAELARLVEAGFVEWAEQRLRLTEEGLLVADAVMAEFF